MTGEAQIEAVIFDWGGTLTPWHEIDFAAESRALAAAVTPRDPESEDEDLETYARSLAEALRVVWERSRDHHRSASVQSVFLEASLQLDEDRLGPYQDFWEPHTFTDEQAVPLLRWLRAQGLRVGVLSNTIWPRAWHRRIFERDGIAHLIDGDVYTSEIAWTKPDPRAFHAAMTAVGTGDPARCVFVGDRLFDDMWGAANAGMRTVFVPHSRIPAEQVGHSEGEPDATVETLAEVGAVIERLLVE